MKVFNLIAGPRNLSTPLMYAFAQRKDMQVLDEPFYGFYLKNGHPTNSHPSQQEIILSMELNKDRIIANINRAAQQSHIFIKGMAHHYLVAEPEFILEWENIFLIRSPEKLIRSFSRVISKPTLNDIGLKKSSDLYEYVKRNNKNPVVMDSDELLKNPKTYLQKLCKKIGLPFFDTMLHWKKGGLPEDGIWKKHWYHNLHNSTGFIAKKSQDKAVPKHLESLLAEARPYYRILEKERLLNV